MAARGSRLMVMGTLLSAHPILVLAQVAQPTADGSGGGESHADYPMGCFSYGYQFQPAMVNVSGMPFRLGSEHQCQSKCKDTLGCYNFGFFKQSSECWLGGINSHLITALTQGVVSGPRVCPTEPPACSVIPDAGFPGPTQEDSRSSWPTTGEQPSSLQCWPRKAGGFPNRCNNRIATVLEDTNAGWPGRCDMGNFRTITNLMPGETCQLRCFKSILCGVWILEKQTTGQALCWQSLNGQNCYKSTGVTPMRAQRVMHGSFRVLANTMGMQIMDLTQAFEATPFPEWNDGADRCRLACLSYLFCQYWQYSDVYGCWIEDPRTKSVAYPLVTVPGAMNLDNGGSVKAGEYIQHTCPAGPMQPLPIDPTLTAVAVRAPSPPPMVIAPPAIDTEHREPGFMEGESEDTGDSGGVPWATILMLVLLALCLAGLGTAAYMFFMTKSSRSSTKRGLGSPAAKLKDESRSSSFGSHASGQPLVNNGHQHGSFVQGMQSMNPWQHNQGYGQPGYGHPPGYGQPAYGQVPQQHPQYPPTQQLPQTQQMPGTYRGWG